MKQRSALLLLFLLVSSPGWAQFDTGTVLGVVRDPSGAVLPGATVTLLNIETGVALTKATDERGAYEFFTVRAGDYRVTAELSGFSPQAHAVKVDVGARQRVDVELRVGTVQEAITVSAVAPRLETDSSQRGQVITGDQTRALPLNGREYSSLALLTTGVRLGASTLTTGGTPREGTFNVNGLRSTFNNFLIDGVDNNAYGTSNQGFSNQVMQPPPDAIGEFKVVTNNISAEYGRAAGATVNVVYQSGGNRFHGAGWEFFRDTKLNATGYFKPTNGEKPPLTRNQFGGVLGGPILKNRAFFFGDYEGFRQTRKVTTPSTIPTPLQRQGLLAVAVVDPRTGITYPAGTALPMTTFARTVLSGLPDANAPGAANNYVILQEFTNHTDKAGGKVDLQVSPALSLFGRYGWRDLQTEDQPPIPLPSGGNGNGQIYARNTQMALGATYVASASSLLEFRFGWSTTDGGKNPPALGSPSAEDAFGITGLPTDPRISGGLPTQVITGYADLGRQATNPQWQYPSVFNPKVNYTRAMGRHSLKSGYEFQRINTEVQDVNPLYGRDTYNGQFSRPAGTAADSQYYLADFMFGLRSQYALSNVFVANLRQNMHFLYLQDDFRAGSRLTLNLGLRYEYVTPHWEADNILSNYDPINRRMVEARDGSIHDRALVSPDRNNFGPRLGFAWTAAEGTVVRGGYGISYTHFNRAGGGNLLPINGPQVINAVVNQTNLASASFRPTEQGYPVGLTDPSKFDPLTSNITYMPEDYQSSPVQSWYLSLQREFGPDMLVDVAYVANRADDLLLFANYNQAAPNNAAGTIPLQARRPIPEFSDITYAFNGGKSRYHALQLKYEWRMTRGTSILSSLTISDTKDNGAGSLEGPNGNFPAPQDFYNLDADFSHSAYHQPYNSTTSIVWALPFGRGQRWGGDMSRTLDALAGGWQIAAINTVYPGEPVTFRYNPAATFVVSGIAQDFRGANNYRPNVTGDPYAPEDQRTISNWFNRNNVTLPTDPSQPFGNAERNSVRGPGFWQVDLAASKQVALSQAARLELRIEAFNLFDRSNFRAPEGNRSLASFGTITSTYDPRQMQLGIKLIW